MSAQHRGDDIDHDVERELLKVVGEAEAARRPAEIVLSGRRYRLVPVEDGQATEDPFKDYDPERARAAVAARRARSKAGCRGVP